LQHGTPIPKREIELRSSGSGPVTTYQLSPEELAKYRAMPTPAPRDSEGRKVSPPVAHKDNFSSEEQSRRDQKRYKKERNGMAQAEVLKSTPSREDYLRLRAAGKTHSDIEDKLRIPKGSLAYWLKKWDLKGITAEKAQELLDQQDAPAAADDAPASELPGTIKIAAEKLFKAAPVAIDHEANVAARILAAEAELHRETDAEIERLRGELKQLRQAITELEEERTQLVQTIERATVEHEEFECLRARLAAAEAYAEGVPSEPENHDPVNHPAHYTAGKVECIDAIEAATTGAAIKYLWRWSRKGGVEDLRKARWYIDRLIEELEGNVG
jgi:hypothetical protein